MSNTLACANIAALPLQILLRAHPDWHQQPVAVVDKDKPQGIILWVNKAAQSQRILSGMRYAQGLSLSRELRGGVVSEHDIATATRQVQKALWGMSPRVEPCTDEDGIFWIDAGGLEHVYPSQKDWVFGIAKALEEIDLKAIVSLGHSRFGTYAASKSSHTHLIFKTQKEEDAHLQKIPIVALGIEPNLRDTLLKLGIQTVGQFCSLPVESIQKRFGAEALTLYSMAQGKGWAPLQPVPIEEPIVSQLLLEFPESIHARIMIHLDPLLHSLIQQLMQRNEVLSTLNIKLTLDNKDTIQERVAPAIPTLDSAQILSLVSLRLEKCMLPEGVVEILLHAQGVTISHDQLTLFNDTSHEAIKDAEHALAKIRAGLGHSSVVHAKRYEGHLPEAQYKWELFDKVVPPESVSVATPSLTRRIFSPPKQLPPCDRRDPDGWLLAGIHEGPVEEVIGPHNLSGGWWRKSISRDYHFVRTRSGKWLWIYYDKNRRRWFLHGEVQ